ncbi:hypothetical protein F4809DRAFT_360221 [Biscogniauxia mediterranea]|nr:hypothetical protein F4809DRAFT_360221 [Biscogniauxia mediterranea]
MMSYRRIVLAIVSLLGHPPPDCLGKAAISGRTNLWRLTDAKHSRPITDMSYSVATSKREAETAAAAAAAHTGAFPSLVQKVVVVVARYSRAIASLAE